MFIRKIILINRKAIFRNYRMDSSFSVLITRNDVPEEGVLLLRSKCKVDMWNQPSPIPREELVKKIKGKSGLFCTLTDKIDEEILNSAGSNLKVIGTMSVGFDHIDVDACQTRGIKIGFTPDILTDATAELTIALLLATSRRIIEASQEVTNGSWKKCSWGPVYMCGSQLSGSTVGIVGLGRIGFGVAERLKSFKVKHILYSGNRAKAEAVEKLNAKFVPFEDLLRQSDFVVCCAALTKSTKGMFNLPAFQKMKENSIFINTSRGGLVDHDALFTALTTGLIKAAGLDVMDPEPLPTDHKLTKLPNCVLLPHIGSATIETRTAMAVVTAKNILAGLEGKSLPCPL